MTDWTSEDGAVRLICGDCRDVLPVQCDAIVTDPPYFKVKAEAWDRQWDTERDFIDFIGQRCEAWHHDLAANGSLYVFASPRMAARVESKIAERFEVLNNLVWAKSGTGSANDAGWHRQACKESLRSFFPASERIIFAEHYGADNIAKGEAGYGAKCDELRGFVFDPLLRYLTDEFKSSRLTRREVDDHFSTANVSQYWLQPRDFIIPTPERYAGLQTLRPQHFQRNYEDLRREYEDLRREYEDLRRPFHVTADVPYTDVWTFPTVGTYKGKHPCEKPLAMMEHIVTASTRPDAVVRDDFMGSGTTGVACVRTGRRFVGIELDAGYFEIAKRRIQAAMEKRDSQLIPAA